MNEKKYSDIRHFSTLPLKHRLLITYLLLSGVILLISALSFYSSSKKVLIDNAAAASEQQLFMIADSLSEKLGHITDYAITLSINSEIADILYENPTVPPASLDRFFINSALTKQVQRIIGLHKNIYQWDILDTENNWFHSSTTITEELDPFLNEILLDTLQDSSQLHFIGPFMISGEPMFAALKPINDINTMKYLGTVVLLIKETNISSAFHDLPDGHSTDFYILDNSSQILSATDPDGIYKIFWEYVDIDSLILPDPNMQQNIRLQISGDNTLLIQKNFPGMDWTIVNLIPVSSLNLGHTLILKQIILLCLLLFLLSLLFSVLCSRTVTAPIQKLASKMQTASQGNLNVTASYYANDEIAVLYNQFNILIQRIHTLLDNVYREQEDKRKMEIRLLQSQINPHFLYNTLNMINSLIELGMKTEAVNAVSALSGFYRNSLSKGSFLISLEKELELTEQYLFIESLRFMEYMDYEIIVDSKYPLRNIKIPKLTLQPIIENIFVHGLSKKYCHIRVTLMETDKELKIVVFDNGTGIPADMLEQIHESLRNGPNAEGSFGLPNIQQRLCLLYGEPYGLQISSLEHEFTEIIIRIPKGEKVDENNRID